jgi:hypothetical protein
MGVGRARHFSPPGWATLLAPEGGLSPKRTWLNFLGNVTCVAHSSDERPGRVPGPKPAPGAPERRQPAIVDHVIARRTGVRDIYIYIYIYIYTSPPPEREAPLGVLIYILRIAPSSLRHLAGAARVHANWSIFRLMASPQRPQRAGAQASPSPGTNAMPCAGQIARVPTGRPRQLVGPTRPASPTRAVLDADPGDTGSPSGHTAGSQQARGVCGRVSCVWCWAPGPAGRPPRVTSRRPLHRRPNPPPPRPRPTSPWVH